MPDTLTPIFANSSPLILASASPRRQSMLRQLGLDFAIQPADIDETVGAGESAEHLVRRLAASKATLAVQPEAPNSTVLAADTVVTLEDVILGKPSNADEALTMLRRLRDRCHQVITGLAIVCPAKNLHFVHSEVTTVRFGYYNDAALKAYIATNEPNDKAGAYGIQGIGGFLVSAIQGSYSNVVGLPLDPLLTILLRHGIITAVEP